MGRSARLNPAGIKRIAFIRLDHIGDAVMSSPLLKAIHEWAPGAEITVVARPQSAEYFRLLPFVKSVKNADVPWIRPDSSSWNNFRACLRLAGEIRGGKFDLAIDLRYHNRLDSLLLSLSGAKSALGFDAGHLGFGVTHCAPLPRTGHEIARGARALEQFGIRVKSRETIFPVSAGTARICAGLMGRGRKTVAIHPGAGNAIKRWMPERFGAVAGWLAERKGARIVLLGGPGESGLGTAVARAVPRKSLVDLRGKLGLAGMAGVMKQCRLFIGNDGGPAQVAGAVGVPVLVVFSGTSIARDWAPLGKKVRVVEKQVPCKPCYSTSCPFNQACLRAAGVDEVAALAGEMLAGR